MRNFTIYLAGLLCLAATRMMAQDGPKDFEGKARVIAQKIEKAREDETAQLKVDVDAINKSVAEGKLTSDQGETKKTELAATHAENLRVRTEGYEDELHDLVQQTVDGKVTTADTIHKGNVEISLGFPIQVKDNSKKKPALGEPRTTSQFVIAAGANNLVTKGAIANSDFAYLRSVFFEWGFTHNTRIFKDNSLYHFTYGVTGMYNVIAPTQNRYFVDNGNDTNLETFPYHLRTKDSYFKNVYITIPMHLEFDFSKKEIKDGKTYFHTHQGFRFGIGGYVGYNTNSKQFLTYKVDDYRIHEKQKGDFNVNDWNYGLSTYVGWKELSLYCKYDLSPMFTHNSVAQRNISLGFRMDLN